MREGAEALGPDGPPGRADRVRSASAQAVHSREVGAVMDRRPELLRRGMHADRTELGRVGDTLPGIGGADEACGIHARTPCPARAREPVEDTDAAH